MSDGVSIDHVDSQEPDATSSEHPPPWDSELEKRRDEAVILIVNSLDQCIEQASNLNITIAVHILKIARESIIHWIAKTGFQDTSFQAATLETQIDKLDLIPLITHYFSRLFGSPSQKRPDNL